MWELDNEYQDLVESFWDEDSEFSALLNYDAREESMIVGTPMSSMTPLGSPLSSSDAGNFSDFFPRTPPPASPISRPISPSMSIISTGGGLSPISPAPETLLIPMFLP